MRTLVALLYEDCKPRDDDGGGDGSSGDGGDGGDGGGGSVDYANFGVRKFLTQRVESGKNIGGRERGCVHVSDVAYQ